jgi:coproporphyrinogen III oxidase
MSSAALLALQPHIPTEHSNYRYVAANGSDSRLRKPYKSSDSSAFLAHSQQSRDFAAHYMRCGAWRATSYSPTKRLSVCGNAC